MKAHSLESFYAKFAAEVGDAGLAGQAHEVGHFNVFNIANLAPYVGGKRPMLFDRRLYYTINLCTSPGRVDYADRVLDITERALFLATPRVPYRWVPGTSMPTGYSCLFNQEFLLPAKSGVVTEELPIFQPAAYPLWEVSEADSRAVEAIFEKMVQEITSAYAYKHDLLRTYLWELIHLVQKGQPVDAAASPRPADRLAAQFTALLERQFPLENPRQRLRLRTPADFANQLAVHVNYLNRVLKEATGHTTSTLIGNRLTQEAKILLRQTGWSVSEIADCLGFGDVAHFCTAFKRQTKLTPGDFRG